MTKRIFLILAIGGLLVFSQNSENLVLKRVDRNQSLDSALKNHCSKFDLKKLYLQSQREKGIEAAAGTQALNPSAMAGPPWQPVGPEGGTIEAIVANPNNPSEVYAVSSRGQVFKSANSGDSWNRISVIMDSTYDIAIDPTNPSTIYVTSSYRFYKSTDGGLNWQYYSFGSHCYSFSGRMIAINPANPSIIYVGGYYYYDTVNWKYAMAVFKSTNGGQTWETKRLSGNTQYALCYSLALDKMNPETLFAGGYEYDGYASWGKLYKTSNGGTSWTDTIGTIAGDPQTVIVAPNNSNNVFVGNYNGVFRSTNGGQTWTQNTGYAAAYELAVDPANPNTLYGGYSGRIFISTDGGINWNSYISGLAGNCNALVPRSATLLYGSSSGVYKSTDGGFNWNQSHSGIQALSIPAVAFAPAARNTVFCEGTANGFFKSTDWGANWARLPDFYRCDAITKIIPNPANASDLFILASG